MVLKSADDIERLLADEEMYNLDEDMGSEDEFPVKSVPAAGDGEPIGDSMDLYLLECRRTRLLTGDEEKTLGSSIEDGRYISEMDQELVAKNGYPPSETDLLLELIRRLCQSSSLLNMASRHLKLQVNGGVLKKVLAPELRSAIDGQIDQHLSGAISQATGATEAQTVQDLVELSLITRLIPWHIIRGLEETGSIAELKRALRSPKFRGALN